MDIKINFPDTKTGNKLFTDVALVVDQEGFEEQIIKARKKLKKEDINKHPPKHSLTDKDVNNSKVFDNVVEKVRKSLRLSKIFNGVIGAAIFGRTITHDDYSPALLISDEDYFDEEGELPDYHYSILLSPQARDKDVIEQFQKYRDEIHNYLNKNVGDYKFIPVLSTSIEKGKPSIRLHRDFYLRDKRGESIDDICTYYFDKCPLNVKGETHATDKSKPKKCTCFDESAIRHAIKNYSKLLWKSRTF